MRAPGRRGAEPRTRTRVASATSSPCRCQRSRSSKRSFMTTGSLRAPPIEHRGGDQLLEIPGIPPRELQLLGAPKVELDVVLDREADAAMHLLGHRGDI